ncbi:hypothetical protein GF340_03765 [Candidatus Peregrinibacteria bacterium]|nr:hypothetical protein [Candidatus Peregrinibacteria bacterium]
MFYNKRFIFNNGPSAAPGMDPSNPEAMQQSESVDAQQNEYTDPAKRKELYDKVESKLNDLDALAKQYGDEKGAEYKRMADELRSLTEGTNLYTEGETIDDVDINRYANALAQKLDEISAAESQMQQADKPAEAVHQQAEVTAEDVPRLKEELRGAAVEYNAASELFKEYDADSETGNKIRDYMFQTWDFILAKQDELTKLGVNSDDIMSQAKNAVDETAKDRVRTQLSISKKDEETEVAQVDPAEIEAAEAAAKEAEEAQQEEEPKEQAKKEWYDYPEGSDEALMAAMASAAEGGKLAKKPEPKEEVKQDVIDLDEYGEADPKAVELAKRWQNKEITDEEFQEGLNNALEKPETASDANVALADDLDELTVPDFEAAGDKPEQAPEISYDADALEDAYQRNHEEQKAEKKEFEGVVATQASKQNTEAKGGKGLSLTEDKYTKGGVEVETEGITKETTNKERRAEKLSNAEDRMGDFTRTQKRAIDQFKADPSLTSTKISHKGYMYELVKTGDGITKIIELPQSGKES